MCGCGQQSVVRLVSVTVGLDRVWVVLALVSVPNNVSVYSPSQQNIHVAGKSM
jgi:hypothetical protein